MVCEEEQYERLVPVRDLKQFLVEEFEKNRTVRQELAEKKNEVMELQKNVVLYNNSLVLIDELTKRDNERLAEINRLKSIISQKDKEISMVTDKLNNEKIRNNELTTPYKELKEKVTAELNIEFMEKKREYTNKCHEKHLKIIDFVKNQKGVLSKQKITDYFWMVIKEEI